MEDHVKISHLTKFHAFRANRNQVIDLETWFKIRSKSVQTSLTLKHRPPKQYKLLKIFISFVTTVKSRHSATI